MHLCISTNSIIFTVLKECFIEYLVVRGMLWIKRLVNREDKNWPSLDLDSTIKYMISKEF